MFTLVYPGPDFKPVEVKASCPKHRKYDPSVTGYGGVLGGCKTCRLMLEVFEASKKAELAMSAMRVNAELLDEAIHKARAAR